jgi:SAM-dependent methyltransferase
MTRAIPIALLVLAHACGGAEPQPKPAAAPAPDTAAAPAPGPAHNHAGDDAAPHQHEPLGHRFEDAEKWAKRFDAPERDRWQKPARVVALMNIEPGMAVADIGAGTGYFLPHLARAAGAKGSVLALDIEPSMVEHMRKRAQREGLANVTAREVGVADPGLPAGVIDRVLIVNTWHHIPAREAYAARLAAGLTRGGTVTIVDYEVDSPRGPPVAERLAPEVVIRELAAGGLSAKLVSEDLPYQYVVVARRR